MSFETPTIEREQVAAMPHNGEVPPRIIRPAAPQEPNALFAYDTKNILPNDFTGLSTVIEVPPYGFIPDNWSRALLRGLRKLDTAGKTVLEPGMGTGVNLGYLANRPKNERPKALWGGDYDRRMAPVAARNIDRMLTSEERSTVHVCEGELSLIAWAEKHKVQPDIVYGCLPQVPCPKSVHLGEGDSFSHYYEVDHHEAEIDDFGLGLQRLLLLEARELLAKNGSVVLNLGGRPGRDLLMSMFEKNGFAPEVLHAEILRQHEGTNLEPLARREHVMKDSTGHEFEFFGDPEGNEPINATEALNRRNQGLHVYHSIYVIQATIL